MVTWGVFEVLPKEVADNLPTVCQRIADDGATGNGSLSTEWLVGQKWKNTNSSVKTLKLDGSNRDSEGSCHRPLSFTTDNAVYHQWPPCRVDTLCNHLALMGLKRGRPEFFKAPLG